MPKAVRKGAAPSVIDGVIHLQATDLRVAAGRWNKVVNWVSGTIVLAYGNKGLKRADLRKSIELLRQCADEMEKFA